MYLVGYRFGVRLNNYRKATLIILSEFALGVTPTRLDWLYLFLSILHKPGPVVLAGVFSVSKGF